MANLLKVAKVQLSYKPHYNQANRPVIKGPAGAYRVFKSNWDTGLMEFLEEFKVILLNQNMNVLGIHDVALGGTYCTIVDPKVILIASLLSGASSIILAHNRPSGDLTPTTGEKALTKQINEGAKLIGIKVLDHLILNNRTFFSYSTFGYL